MGRVAGRPGVDSVDCSRRPSPHCAPIPLALRLCILYQICHLALPQHLNDFWHRKSLFFKALALHSHKNELLRCLRIPQVCLRLISPLSCNLLCTILSHSAFAASEVRGGDDGEGCVRRGHRINQKRFNHSFLLPLYVSEKGLSLTPHCRHVRVHPGVGRQMRVCTASLPTARVIFRIRPLVLLPP